MTHKEKADAICAHIRQQCGLMEQTRGCRVLTSNDGAEAIWEYLGNNEFYTKDVWECLWSNFATVRWSNSLSDKGFTIIGHPIDYKHLLQVLPNHLIGCDGGVYIFCGDSTEGRIRVVPLRKYGSKVVFNTTKTVEENLLGDADLCEAIYKILFKD